MGHNKHCRYDDLGILTIHWCSRFHIGHSDGHSGVSYSLSERSHLSDRHSTCQSEHIPPRPFLVHCRHNFVFLLWSFSLYVHASGFVAADCATALRSGMRGRKKRRQSRKRWNQPPGTDMEPLSKISSCGHGWRRTGRELPTGKCCSCKPRESPVLFQDGVFTSQFCAPCQDTWRTPFQRTHYPAGCPHKASNGCQKEQSTICCLCADSRKGGLSLDVRLGLYCPPCRRP